MKSYKHPPAKDEGADLVSLEELLTTLSQKQTSAIIAVLMGLQTDTPVPISLLKGFCSHSTLHEHYLRKGVGHYIIDQKTCVRISEFVQAREARAKIKEAPNN